MSEAPRIDHLDPSDFRRTPWKNGGGTTVDIADRYRPGHEPGGWTGLVWRFGRTRIEVPAPFSDLSGLDRILTVVGGRGLVLRVADGRALDVRAPFRPVAFPGDWPIRSELEAGAVEVVNLVGDRSAVRLAVAVLGGPGPAAELPAGEHVLYGPEGESAVAIAGREVALAGGAAARFATAAPVEATWRSGTVVIASAMPIGPGTS